MEASVVTVRDAMRSDVPRIVALYGTDEFARKHGDEAAADDSPAEPGYYAAFDAISADARNRLLVAVASGGVATGGVADGVVAGSFQLTYVPDMNADGNDVAIIENVIVDGAMRGRGIGSAMMRWAIDEARARGCYRVALMSRNVRTDAHRFYARLGFDGGSTGFKLYLGG